MELGHTSLSDSFGYSASSRTLLPGIVVGILFTLGAATISSATTQKEQRLEQQLPETTQGTFETMPLKRMRLTLLSDHEKGSSKSPDDASVARNFVAEEAIQQLSDGDGLASFEKVIVEIPLQSSGELREQRADLQKSIPQLLARRTSSLGLQILLRVAPQNVPLAIEIASDLNARMERLKLNVAVGADSRLGSEIMQVEVNRTIRLVEPEKATE